MDELPQVHGISISGMNPNMPVYAGPWDWTQVAAEQREAANHYTNNTGHIDATVLTHESPTGLYLQNILGLYGL